MTIRKFVWLASGLMLLVLLVSAYAGLRSIDEIRMGGPLQRQTQEASDLVADILPPPEYVIEPWLEANELMREPQRAGSIADRLTKLRRDYDQRHAYWLTSEIDPDVKRLITVQTHDSATRFWDELENVFVPAARRGDREAMERSFATLQRDYQAHRVEIDRTVEAANAYRTRIEKNAADRLSIARAVLGSLAALLAVMLLGFPALVLSRIVRPLVTLTEHMQRMGRGEAVTAASSAPRRDELGDAEQALGSIVRFVEQRAIEDAERQGAVQRQVVAALGKGLSRLHEGDLDHRIDSGFPEDYRKLRDDFNSAADSMRDTIGTVVAAIERLTISSREINAATQDLSSRNELQASHLKDTASAVQALNTHVRATAVAAESAAHTVSQAQGEASENADVVDAAVAAMREIETSTRSIVSITEVIDKLANQTHLLSLNASVEAARAGAAGRGFAVVSEEVRALAQNSGHAAQQIKELIGESSAKVEGGVTLVDSSGQAVGALLGRIREISALIEKIADAAREQSARLETINGSILSIDQVTQQNAAMSEECSAAANLLDSEARQLAELTRRFQFSRRAERQTPTLVTAEPIRRYG